MPDYKVTVFDQHRYDETGYQPGIDTSIQAASVDENKIVGCPLQCHHCFERTELNPPSSGRLTGRSCTTNDLLLKAAKPGSYLTKRVYMGILHMETAKIFLLVAACFACSLRRTSEP